jgi:hypothetical protein
MDDALEKKAGFNPSGTLLRISPPRPVSLCCRLIALMSRFSKKAVGSDV